MTSNPKQLKHVPQRTCIACRKVKNKRELMRLVRIPDNSVEVDETGKKPGRGVYLCRNAECWETGLKGDRLEHGLKAVISPENRQRLMELGRNICGTGNRI